jgi:glycosyltransferase involved in cell wall biosynthesis
MPTAGRLAFVCPRFAEGATVGGAETLFRALAMQARAAGRDVVFLTTCARNHVSWANELPPGERLVEGLSVHTFPVNTDRDPGLFLRLQDRVGRGHRLSPDDEQIWLRNNVRSDAMARFLVDNGGNIARVIAGPYLFGVVHQAIEALPGRGILLPCLHDEPFAYLGVTRTLFGKAAGVIFNSEPERDLACRLFSPPASSCHVVGIGLDARAPADPHAFAARHNLAAPYIVYSGRKEPLKGTPLLVDYFAAFRKRTARDLRLVLTGSGSVEVPSDVKSAVHDFGFLSEEEKNEAMAGAIAFCHASVNESLSIVLLEAWLNRTPALVHASGVVLRHQCRRSNGGLWFRNYAEFEAMLMRIWDDSALRETMGEAGRAYVLAQYAWPAVRARLLDAVDA